MDWDKTRTSLHQAAQVLSAIRGAALSPLPNWAHLGLYVTSHGVTTGPLPIGAELSLNFDLRDIIYTPIGTKTTRTMFDLDDYHQVSLTDAMLALLSSAGHPLNPKRDKLTHQTPLEADAQLAADYAEALYRVYTAMARFRARLLGPMSPIVVWAHGFDLSFLWFAGSGFGEAKDPHLNFGFSPGSPGLDRPYVYAYAYPIPKGLTDLPLPSPARWYTTGWTGIVVDYDQIASSSNPEGLIEELLSKVYATIAPLMR
jgi:hypothetical protein